VLEDGIASPWLRLSAHQYDSHMGAGRRYALGPGIEASLLVGELMVGVGEVAGLRTRWLLYGMRHLRSGATVLNPGFHLRLLDVDYHRYRSDQFHARWGEVGPVLELFQTGGHRNRLLFETGAVLRSDVDLSDTSSLFTRTGVGTPVRLRGTVASPRQAMTRFDVAATWEPVITPDAAIHEPGLDAEIGLRLAEIFGIEAGVRADARARWPSTFDAPLGAPLLRGAVGLAFEPF